MFYASILCLFDVCQKFLSHFISLAPSLCQISDTVRMILTVDINEVLHY